MKKKITLQNILILALLIIAAYRFTFMNDGDEKADSGAKTGNEEIQFDEITGIETVSEFNHKNPQEKTVLKLLCRSERNVFRINGSDINNEYENMYIDVMNEALENENGMQIIHARTGVNEEGWLCRNISADNMKTDQQTLFMDRPELTSRMLKPVMKIKESDYFPGDTTKVVEVSVLNFKGDVIYSEILRIQNFCNDNLEYSGDYISNYSMINLCIMGRSDSTEGLNFGRYSAGKETGESKIDFRVYWFGLVDVWFEKMIVDDETADELFGIDFAGNYDTKIRDVTTLENYFYVLSLIKEKKYTPSNIMPINYVLNVMNRELKKQNLLPFEIASAR